MEPNKRYTQTVDKSFHVSMASLDYLTSSDDMVQVMLCYESRNYLLCSLKKSSTCQVPLDLNFQQGMKIAFTCNGHGHVHLTGYLIPEDDLNLDELEDEEEDEQDEQEEQEKAPKLTKGAKRKMEKELKSSVESKRVKQEAESSDEDDYFNATMEDDSEDSEEGELGEEDSDESEEMEEDTSELEGEEEVEEEEKPAKPVQQQKKQKQKQKNQNQAQNANQNQHQNQTQEKSKKKQEKEKLLNGKEAKQVEQKQKKNKEQKQREQEQNQNVQEQKKKSVEGGVQIEEVKVGGGQPAKAGKFVSVYYVGRLKNGKKFDSVTQGDGFKFRLGKGEVIKGWDVGITGMKVGGKRRITIPPGMAYGSKGSPPVIPPHSILSFEVELRNVH